MNLRIQYALFFLLSLTITTAQSAAIIGYYTNWNDKYKPSDVKYDKLTHIQFAFLVVKTDGTVELQYKDSDEDLLLGPELSSQTRDSSQGLIPLAHKKNVKVLASVGGWEGSSNFSSAASTPQNRTRFASTSAQLIRNYGFDGIDIDWEYPCLAEHNGKPEDKDNFSSLIAVLRDTLNAFSGSRKLITITTAGSGYYGQNFAIENFIDDVDYISVMTYDYAGTWMSTSWHNSPLYSYGLDDNYSLSRAMEYYLGRNIPASKLNIGVAFYGRTFSGCNGPNGPFTGEGSGESGQPGYLFYPTITKKLLDGTYERRWDDQAKVPYAVSSGEFCTYDDTVSIRLKGEYCKKNGLGGAIIWELSCDKMDNKSEPLLDALYASMQPVAEVRNVTDNKIFSECTLKATINKKGEIKISYILSMKSDVKLIVVNGAGKVISRGFNAEESAGKHTLSLKPARLVAGVYFVKLQAGKSRSVGKFVLE